MLPDTNGNSSSHKNSFDSLRRRRFFDVDYIDRFESGTYCLNDEWCRRRVTSFASSKQQQQVGAMSDDENYDNKLLEEANGVDGDVETASQVRSLLGYDDDIDNDDDDDEDEVKRSSSGGGGCGDDDDYDSEVLCKPTNAAQMRRALATLVIVTPSSSSTATATNTTTSLVKPSALAAKVSRPQSQAQSNQNTLFETKIVNHVWSRFKLKPAAITNMVRLPKLKQIRKNLLYFIK